MKKFAAILSLLWLLFVVLDQGTQAQNATTKTNRLVAITFDDLPVISLRGDIESRRETTLKLLEHIKTAKVPAIGFINERQLFPDNKRDEAQVALLRAWLDRGLELGNHTYSHPDLHKIPLEEYMTDVIRGEVVTTELLKARGKSLRFFRHPFLHTGRDLETKQKFEEFLKERGYRVAPVTFDNNDYIFAGAYKNAFLRDDKEMMKRIGEAYVPYLESVVDYYERQSVKLFGREVRQILLLHANSINADYFDEVAAMLKKRGYTFITLEEALKDEAYKSPDTFTGPQGPSWLHRWAITRGKENLLQGEPNVPEWVMK